MAERRRGRGAVGEPGRALRAASQREGFDDGWDLEEERATAARPR